MEDGLPIESYRAGEAYNLELCSQQTWERCLYGRVYVSNDLSHQKSFRRVCERFYETKGGTVDYGEALDSF